MRTTHTRVSHSIRPFVLSMLRLMNVWHLLFIVTLVCAAVWLSGLGLKLFSPAKAAFAATYFVRTDGSDTLCNGTANASSIPANQPNCAFLTITKAVNTAIAGDTINVAAGTYTETVTINQSVTLNGNQAGVSPNDAMWNDTRTNPANESIIHGAVNLSLRNNIVMDGFTLERTDTNEGHVLIGSGNPTGVGASSSFNLKNNRIIGTRNIASPGSPWAGIHTNFLNDPASPGGQFVSHRNRIVVAGTATGSGILINANVPGTDGLGATTITETYVASSPGNGFNVNRPGASALINGNRVVNDDIFTFRANSTVITNNTISDAPQAAISNTGGSTTWTASNNTIISPRAQAFLVGSTFTVDPISGMTISGNTVTVDPALVGVGVLTVISPLQYALTDIRGNLIGTNLVNNNSISLSSNPLNPTAAALYGLRVRDNVGNLSVTNNTFNGNGVGGAGDATLPASSGVFVDTNAVTAALDLKAQNNLITGWANGVVLFDTVAGSPVAGIQPVQLVSNNISGNNTGVLIDSGVSGGTALLNFNRIINNLTAGLRNTTANAIIAENNWWGCNFGPGVGGTGCVGTPNSVSNTGGGSVDFNPWLVLGITAVPNTVGIGGMSNLTADLTFNSTPADTSGSGNLPNGTPATFAGTLGTVAPMSATTTSGKANSVYTATTGGMGSASTTVDMQTVSTPITVNQFNTTTTVTASPTPSVFGQSVTFTATVTSGSGTPTGNVQFVIDGGAPVTVALDGSGQATLTTSLLTAGPHTVVANYQGAANFATSSGTVSHTVNKANTTTAITADNPDPSAPGQAVTVAYTVTANPPGAGTPTGNVTINATTGESCIGTVAAGSCTITFNTPGTRTLTATYAGDTNFNGSTSAGATHQVLTGLGFTGNLADPLVCTGPGNVLNVTASVTNPNAVTVNVDFSATPTVAGQLLVIGGSCTATGQLSGTCTTTAPTQVSFSGTLAAGQTITFTYRVQVADNVTSGTSVCMTSTASLNSIPLTPIQACTTANCPAVGPGLLFSAAAGAAAEVSDQKAGSVLFYNIYSSSIAAPNAQNTRISITNTHPGLSIAVHLFFVDGATCSIADSLVCLTPNQTASFLASDIDPGTTGYIVAVASDLVTGCPVDFNYLIGDEYVKLSSGHAANLAAEGFAALAGGLPACNGLSVTALLSFDGVSYNRAPRVLAASNIPSRADGNDTLIVLNRFGGSLAAGASTLGSIFGILYDDAENPLSFTFTAGVCQFRSSLSSSFPRVAPRFEQFIPAGRSGWAKFYSQSDIAILGAQLNFNANAGTAANAFNQGHNLHKLTLTTAATLTIPIFPPNC